jgi:hypothetical protein
MWVEAYRPGGLDRRERTPPKCEKLHKEGLATYIVPCFFMVFNAIKKVWRHILFHVFLWFLMHFDSFFIDFDGF